MKMQSAYASASKSTNKVNKKVKEQEPSNDLHGFVDLEKIRKEIINQYGSVYAYCSAFEIQPQEMTRFFNENAPITFKQLWKHCNNLKMRLRVILSNP